MSTADTTSLGSSMRGPQSSEGDMLPKPAAAPKQQPKKKRRLGWVVVLGCIVTAGGGGGWYWWQERFLEAAALCRGFQGKDFLDATALCCACGDAFFHFSLCLVRSRKLCERRGPREESLGRRTSAMPAVLDADHLCPAQSGA